EPGDARWPAGTRLDATSRGSHRRRPADRWTARQRDDREPRVVCMTVRVLLIDDHPVVLDGLTIALEAHGVEIAGRARTLAEARTLLATVEAEVALLDLRLPDGSG